MAPELAGRVAIVTGAGGRLGKVWRGALEGAGATVVGVDLQAGEGIEAADVTDRAALERVCERVCAEAGTPRILVNNAGIDQPPDAAAHTYAIEDVPLEDFRATLDVNLAGAFAATQVFGARMRDSGDGGAIVNIGSVYASVAPEPRFYDHLDVDPPFLKPAAYAASKSGLVALTRYFARLWGPAGVRVNALSPGGVAAGQDSRFVEKYTARVPLERMAEEDDLTGPLLFLVSDAARYVTGHELRVDGGFTA
jgi:NAD(P)-dependent dehydrogenase (short-subunit alcohol dehydrogenase family)